ncbi:MAG: dynamin family protein, partial [Planctomycetota bacterium]
MSNPEISADAVGGLLDWYQSKARPFLEKMQPEKIADFDGDVERIKQAQATLQKELSVCFLGNSGVGKSTLINALVAGNEIILPSGGIGPLTAQALVVKYGAKQRFVVKYHAPKNLWRLTFGLDRSLAAERKRAEQKEGLLPPDDLFEGVDDEDRKEIETSLVEGGSQRSKIDEYKKQALLMIVGDQDGQAELPYLVDCLRTILGKERIWGTSIRPEDETRIRNLQTILEKASDDNPRSMSADNPTFKKMLHAHASGFLAPMIKELTVYWDSPVLRSGVALVDLPGLGIANDVYQAVTSEWVRERAEAIVLVVETRGVTEVNAELLRTSGFLNRLLHASDDPTVDPVELMVAVVKGDVIADERYTQERDKNKKKKRDHLADVTEATIRHIKDHLRPQLAKVWTSESEQVGQAQQGVIDRIIEKLEVHPVSAVQFRKLLANDEEDRAFITDAGQSGMPQL